MKKQFDVEGIDCAVCAGKLEDALKKIDGVEDVSVNFLLEKVTFVYADENEKKIFSEARKVTSKVLPDAEILF